MLISRYSASSWTLGGRPVLLGQLLLRLFDLERLLLSSARHVYRPAEVAEVALELTENRRHRERGEGGPALGVEAVDRLDEAQAGDLEKVVERLSRAGVPSGELARQGQEAGYELVARAAVSVLLPADEELGRVGPGDR